MARPTGSCREVSGRSRIKTDPTGTAEVSLTHEWRHWRAQHTGGEVVEFPRETQSQFAMGCARSAAITAIELAKILAVTFFLSNRKLASGSCGRLRGSSSVYPKWVRDTAPPPLPCHNCWEPTRRFPAPSSKCEYRAAQVQVVVHTTGRVVHRQTKLVLSISGNCESARTD